MAFSDAAPADAVVLSVDAVLDPVGVWVDPGGWLGLALGLFLRVTSPRVEVDRKSVV